MLFITINEACNPWTIVPSLNLSKHNSYSQRLQLSLPAVKIFSRNSQDFLPWNLIDWIQHVTHKTNGNALAIIMAIMGVWSLYAGAYAAWKEVNS